MSMIDKKCLECDCYDEDFECTMPSIDKEYACPLYSNEKLKKEYYILPIDNYGQPDGNVNKVFLTEEEYNKLKETYVYVYDDLEQAYRRALD